VLASLAAVVGIGVRAPSLGLYALLIALGGMLTGLRGAIAIALLSTVSVFGLYFAEIGGWIGGATAIAAQPPDNRLHVLLLLVFIGGLAGWALSSIYQRALETATLLGERLERLLSLGTDWVWEQDPEGRFTYLSPSLAARVGVDAQVWIGRCVWEIPGVIAPKDGWTAMREFVARQRPLRDELVQLEAPDGRRVSARLSGEAVLDEAGRCTGWRGVGHDVSAQVDEEERRLAVQAQLEIAKEQAEAASRAKSAFLATMSHEIRTPLNGALGMMRLAIEAGDDARRRDEYLRYAMASGSTLGGIISDILDLSRIEAGGLQIEITSFDLHELARSVVASLAALARGKRVEVGCEIAPLVPRFVRGDPLRVRQVLVNYLSNAIKFTHAGRVDLRVSALGAETLRFEVRDTGVGIGADTLPRLAIRFAFDGVGDEARQAFMRHFDLYTQRGGG
jgi:PAS domain S-box-containing protein